MSKRRHSGSSSPPPKQLRGPNDTASVLAIPSRWNPYLRLLNEHVSSSSGSSVLLSDGSLVYVSDGALVIASAPLGDFPGGRTLMRVSEDFHLAGALLDDSLVCVHGDADTLTVYRVEGHQISVVFIEDIPPLQEEEDWVHWEACSVADDCFLLRGVTGDPSDHLFLKFTKHVTGCGSWRSTFVHWTVEEHAHLLHLRDICTVGDTWHRAAGVREPWFRGAWIGRITGEQPNALSARRPGPFFFTADNPSSGKTARFLMSMSPTRGDSDIPLMLSVGDRDDGLYVISIGPDAKPALYLPFPEEPSGASGPALYLRFPDEQSGAPGPKIRLLPWRHGKIADHPYQRGVFSATHHSFGGTYCVRYYEVTRLQTLRQRCLHCAAAYLRENVLAAETLAVLPMQLRDEVAEMSLRLIAID